MIGNDSVPHQQAQRRKVVYCNQTTNKFERKDFSAGKIPGGDLWDWQGSDDNEANRLGRKLDTSTAWASSYVEN